MTITLVFLSSKSLLLHSLYVHHHGKALSHLFYILSKYTKIDYMKCFEHHDTAKGIMTRYHDRKRPLQNDTNLIHAIIE